MEAFFFLKNFLFLFLFLSSPFDEIRFAAEQIALMKNGAENGEVRVISGRRAKSLEICQRESDRARVYSKTRG